MGLMASVFAVRSDGKPSNVYLPTARRNPGRGLLEAGISPAPDERERACYLPVMRMFGVAWRKTAQALSGQRGTVLKALMGAARCKLARSRDGRGLGMASSLSWPARDSERMAVSFGPIAKRTFWRRRREAWNKMSPSTTAVDPCLNSGPRPTDRGPAVAARPVPRVYEVVLGDTPQHRQASVLSRMRDTASSAPKVPMGYSLHRLVGHAIREGIVPVVLAGRFLKNMTHDGFFWLPGVKYEWDGENGDLDIVACCDGNIVVGECRPWRTRHWIRASGKRFLNNSP